LKQFQQIAVIGITPGLESEISSWQSLSESPLLICESTEQLFSNHSDQLGDIAAILLSFHETLSSSDISKLPQLKYASVYGTSTHLVNVKFCQEKSITVTHVPHYCDFDTAEYVLSRILAVLRGQSDLDYSDLPESLSGKTLGLVGLGQVGKEVAKLARNFGMKVNYYTPRPKPDAPDLGISYMDLTALLMASDVVSLHVPRGLQIFDSDDFESFKSKDNQPKLLVNTCLDEVLNPVDLKKWLDVSPKHFYAMDEIAGLSYSELKGHAQVDYISQKAYDTQQARENRARHFLSAMTSFLS
jgi:lactate dehydrogenase-like 2-hydroxyacid dehydrogenase